MRTAGIVALLFLVAGVVVFVPLGKEPAPPPMHRVQRGDTLSAIAHTHGVSVVDIRAWNGLVGDLIEVDRELTVGRSPQQPAPTLWRRWGLDERVAAWRAGGEASPAESTPDPAAMASAHPEKRAAKQRLVGEVFPPDTRPEEKTPPPLRMPAPKACLPADTVDESGSFGRSVGLSERQVSAAFRAFQGNTLRCSDRYPGSAGQVVLRLTIGCDGLVRGATVVDHDVTEYDFALCVADVVRYAPFPAHARDEVEVVVPMWFSVD